MNKSMVGISLCPRWAICCHCIRLQSQTVWRKFMTICPGRGLPDILPMPHAKGPICWKTWRQLQNRKYITYSTVVRRGPSHVPH